MHVDVDGRVRELDKDERCGEPPAREKVAIDLHNGVPQNPIAHGSAVHEEVNAVAGRAVPIRAGGEGQDSDLPLPTFRRYERPGLVLREDRGDSVKGLCRGGPRDRVAVVATNVEVNAWPGEGSPREPVGHMTPFRRGRSSGISAGPEPGRRDPQPRPACRSGRPSRARGRAPLPRRGARRPPPPPPGGSASEGGRPRRSRGGPPHGTRSSGCAADLRGR